MLAMLSLLIPSMALAQPGQGVKVTGKVTDSNNNPLIGASVVEENTTNGTVAGLDGSFEITLGPDARLQVSYLGYITKTVETGGRTNITVTLDENAADIEGVVVIGYGTVAKKDLTGSIQSLSGSDLVKSMNTNISESLNGRVGGVEVVKTSNRPGADMNIRIRGEKSFNFSNEPLYVIDGVPSSSGMRHLNASDIESIDVMKDASSGAIYGSRGANGVVIITTKGASRKEGLTIEYNGYVGIKTPTRIPDMIGSKGNGMDYFDYRVQLWTTKYGSASLGRSDFLTNDEKRRVRDGEFYDWLREISSNSVVTNHSVNASGGSDKTSYNMGLSYTQDQGMVGNENFERYTVNAGIEHRANKFTMGLNTYLSVNETDLGSDEALLNAYFLPPIVSPYDSNGDYLFFCQPTSSKINPFIQIQNHIRQREEFFANANAFIEYKPIRDLSIKTQVAYQHTTDVLGEWVGTFTQAQEGTKAPKASRAEGRNSNLVWDNIATYDKTFAGKHKLNVIGLYSMQREVHKGSSIAGEGLPYDSKWHAIQTADEITSATSYYWEAQMISGMLRTNYTYDDRYLFTLTGRYDGTSRLSKSNRWGFMPSAAIGWQIANERFMDNVKFVDQLKLRVSWGRAGNSSVGHDETWTKLSQSYYVFDGKGENGFGISDLKGNPNLKWEMTSEWNAGLDFTLLNGRISGTLDLYNRKTKDLIFRRSVADLNGYNQIAQNIGKVQNKGVEVGINTVNISTNDFSWRTGITFSLNRNKILSLYDGVQEDLANRWFVGHPMSVYYDLKQLGIWQEWEEEEADRYSAKPGHIKIWDKDESGTIDDRDMHILGARYPSWTGGMNNTFAYRNFDLSVYIYARIGGIYGDDFMYMFTAWDNEHWNKLNVPYWTAENRNNRYPAVGSQSYHTQVLGQIKGSFVKVQNITFGYTVPTRVTDKIGLQYARAYLSVQNPFTFTNYKGPDPEIIGEDVYKQLSLYPMIFSVGLNFKF